MLFSYILDSANRSVIQIKVISASFFNFEVRWVGLEVGGAVEKLKLKLRLSLAITVNTKIFDQSRYKF